MAKNTSYTIKKSNLELIVENIKLNSLRRVK